MKKYSEGTKIEWDWGNGTATGKVKEAFTERVERTIDGNKVVRKADEDDPAYLIDVDDNENDALKSHSELRKVN